MTKFQAKKIGLRDVFSILANPIINNMLRILPALILLLLSAYQLSAQTVNQQSGWLMLLNNTKFNDKWGLQFDLQLRSADRWSHVRNVLIRPGVTYSLDKSNSIALGYLLTTTQTRLEGLPDYTLNEHRIWQQYIGTHKIKSVFASHRLRLEQRFIERHNADDIFAQRFRYFFRLIQPLQKTEASFTKGAFAALQNEVFFNIQNKDQLNKSVFDQNRLYAAAGYRFSKQFDVEAGYMNQTVKGGQNNISNHIVQLALYTRF